MRISTYARVTNPKYADFSFDWADIAKSLGTKAGNAFNTVKGALPTTASGAAKLGAGIGAGVGGLNYLGSDDKSIGNLATSVAGGAAIGGAVGYGGASLKNAYQARRAGQTGLQGGNPNAPQLAPAASTMPQPEAPVPTSNGQPIQTNAPTSQPAPAPVKQQTIDTTAITVPTESGQTQTGASRPYPLANTSTTGTGNEQISPISQQRRPNVPLKNAPAGKHGSGNLPATDAKVGQPKLPVEHDITTVHPDDEHYKNLVKNGSSKELRAYEKGLASQPLTKEQVTSTLQSRSNQRLNDMGVVSSNQLNPSDREYHNTMSRNDYDTLSKNMTSNSSRNTSPFANFKVRRYNGFIY